MNHRNLPLLALVAVHIIAALVLGWVAEDGQPTLPLAIYCGLTFCQTSLLGFWGGLGTNHWLLRLCGVAAGIGFLVPTFDWGMRAHDSSGFYGIPAELFFLIGGCTLLTAVVLLGVRSLAVLRRTAASGDSRASLQREGLQFSIRHLIVLTFVVACLVTLGKALQPHFNGGDDLIFMAAIGVCFAAIGVAAPWAALGAGRPLVRSAIVLGIAAASGIVPIWMRGDWDAWFWISMFVLEAALLLASLAVVRWCGFRLEVRRGPTP